MNQTHSIGGGPDNPEGASAYHFKCIYATIDADFENRRVAHCAGEPVDGAEKLDVVRGQILREGLQLRAFAVG